jgi:hypothetical protein
MKYLATIASILAVAAADTPVTGNWVLYCGSSVSFCYILTLPYQTSSATYN